MGRKPKFNFFFIRKGKPKTNERLTEFEGEPNSNMDKYDMRNGKFVSRRKFNNEGKAYIDLDVATPVHNFDHAHDIDADKQSRSFPREELSRKERRELRKAKRKRKGWNNGK